MTHVQVVNCNVGVTCESPVFWVRNGLFHNVQTVFSTASSVVVGHLEHVTVDTATYLSGGYGPTLNVTNSLLVNVTNPGSYTGSGNATDTSAAFQSVGAGAHYLAHGSPHRQAGTTNISYQLQTDFRDYTTYPPQVIFLTTISTDTTWGPQAAREVGGPPDRGYHYPALDYALGAMKIGECQVTVLPGTAFGEFCVVGLELANGARLVAQGTPDRPIRFVPFPVVQEQQLNWGNSPAPYLICGPTHAGVVSPPPPSLTLRFVQFSQPAANGWGCFSQTDWYAFTVQDVRDCQFLNAWNQFWGLWAVANTIEVRNNLFQRSPASFVGCQTLYVYNNLFWGGSNYFKSHQVGFWTIRDNAFHDTVLTDDSAAGWVSNSHNAYLGASQAQLQNSSGNDVVTNAFAYAAGPYGPWYQASTSLVDRGSQSASAAGLYHETTQADQTRETNSTVDSGFHYVAVDACGQPVDADGDGMADYAEDTNGDGVRQAGETEWAPADTDYDGRTDNQELSEGTDPLDPDSFTAVRLGWWRFNTADWAGEQGQLPRLAVGVQRPTSWSGTALEIPSSAPANLRYHDAEASGAANINCRQGTVRFWFKPNWSSGAGPGTWARLIELGTATADASYGFWAVYLDPQGTLLQFATQGGGAGAWAAVAVNWTAGTWHQIAVTYGPTSSTLYLDGIPAATGSGVTRYPSAAVRAATGLNVGSDATGTQRVNGQLEEWRPSTTSATPKPSRPSTPPCSPRART